MEMFTNHYTGVLGYARMVPLPEAMLLISGELITDISNESPQDNKKAKDNTN